MNGHRYYWEFEQGTIATSLVKVVGLVSAVRLSVAVDYSTIQCSC
jgi:hypothetical protein